MKSLLKKCTILRQRQQYINLAKLKSGGCSVEGTNVITGHKCNKGHKCNNIWSQM